MLSRPGLRVKAFLSERWENTLNYDNKLRELQTLLSTKGRPAGPNRLFFLTLFKRPLPPPPLVFEHLCCGFF